MNSRYNRPGVLPTLCRVSFGLLAMTAFGAPSPVQRYDFQPTNGPVAAGFRPVTPADTNVALLGYGFITPPATAVDGSRQTWQIFDRLVTVTQAIPAAVLSDGTRDCVTTRGGRTFAFRADVPPGDYDVTVWLGNVTRPLFQVRATVNGQGLREQQAVAMGMGIRIGRFQFRMLGKAHAMVEIAGFIKIIADEESDRVLGAHIVGPHASDLINEVVIVMENGLTVRDMVRAIHAHPTLAEGLLEAAEDVHGEAIHVPRPPVRISR